MEQVSSEEHVGSLAEAVLEAMQGCPEAEDKVKAVRDQTKAEKKKLAMAMRAKQLQAFGLKANAMGQVKADQSLLQKFVGLAEESGLSCSICREGYKFQPGKVSSLENNLSLFHKQIQCLLLLQVLAIYTHTVACPAEEFESVSGSHRRTMGYSTVSHFNLVHVDCHSAAVRQNRYVDTRLVQSRTVRYIFSIVTGPVTNGRVLCSRTPTPSATGFCLCGVLAWRNRPSRPAWPGTTRT